MTEQATPPQTPAATASPITTLFNHRRTILILLTIVYMFNFIDRQIIGILSPLIKEDMGLTDSQLGFLKGFAFALFYTIVGVPIAWLADRYNRVTIISVALAVWSGFTAASGLAANYTQLALARIGVGVGEAGGSPPSHSIISDLYAKEERGTALAIYSLGIPFGIMAAYFVTAFLLAGGEADWRDVMIWLGVPGVIFALFLRLVVREPKRTEVSKEEAAEAESKPLPAKAKPFIYIAAASFLLVIVALVFAILYWAPISGLVIARIPFPIFGGVLGAVGLLSSLYYLVFILNVYPPLRTLLSIPSWWGMCAGIALASFVGYSLSGWLIDYIVRAFSISGADFIRLLVVFGIANGTAYAAGVWFGGWLADRRAKKSVGAYASIPAWGLLLGGPLLMLSFWTGNYVIMLVALTAFLFLSGFYIGPSFSVAQTLAPVTVRAMSTALFFFILNFIALGGGPTYVGVASEAMIEAHGETHALRLAMTTLIVPLVLSIIAFFWTSRRLPKDWEAAVKRQEQTS